MGTSELLIVSDVFVVVVVGEAEDAMVQFFALVLFTLVFFSPNNKDITLLVRFFQS
jgi:hypothetical protein